MSAESLRADKWLWHARFFKSRTLASRLCESGRMRVNGVVIRKSHHTLKPGDVLTFAKGADVRVIRVVALGSRRGPATEAQTLYEDLDPPTPRASSASPADTVVAERSAGSGRPTNAERRAIDRLHGEK
ncbi:MAG: RNA-binding S4 domain-containing protein [Rhodospirillales bacterium]|nr:RNA-binding S4 domain-containing protein [Rhodospirillales bacterium]